MENTTYQEYEYPSLLRRYASTLFDLFSLLSVPLILASIGIDLSFLPIYVKLVMFAIFFIYEPIGNTLGCTLGQYLLKIRVRKFNAVDKKLNIIQAIFRQLIKYALGIISFLTISSNDERRAMHDDFSKSIVIKLV